MIRLFIVLLCVSSMTACASGRGSAEFTSPQIEKIALANVSSEQTLAELSVQNGVDPCPRFTDSIDAAEQVLKARPKNYAHML